MIADTVMRKDDTAFRNCTQVRFPHSAIYPELCRLNHVDMMGTGEILAELQAKLDAGEIMKKDIAEAMGVGPNRVSELFGSGRGRGLRHDEAVRLVERFRLEQAQAASPLAPEICRLLVRYLAARLGVQLADDDPRLADLTTTFRAFSQFASDPRVRGSVEATRGFLQAIEALQSAADEAARPESGRQPV